MRKPTALVILAGLVYGGYWLLQKYQIEGLGNISLRPRTTASGGGVDLSNIPARGGRTVKIASFNIQVFGKAKLAKPQVIDVLAETVRRFDLVAIQEVRDKADDALPRFVDQINSTGRKYDFKIGPRLGRTDSKEQYAFVYDAQTIECDPSSIYTINDPDNLFQRPPMVASFRVRGPPPNQAFTFTLVDIHTDPDEAKEECNALAQVYRAVQRDGRGEDDIIVLGDLNADERKFGLLKSIRNITWVVSGVTTNTRRTETYDNILFDRAATVEYTGRWGVFDLVRQFNLTEQQALDVSDHFPVWAEFSSYEGGAPGAVATRTDSVPTR